MSVDRIIFVLMSWVIFEKLILYLRIRQPQYLCQQVKIFDTVIRVKN